MDQPVKGETPMLQIELEPVSPSLIVPAHRTGERQSTSSLPAFPEAFVQPVVGATIEL